MGWNRQDNKSISPGESKAAIGPGAPVAYNANNVGKPYRDAWDIERAYREGVQKVTWVSRCVDAIAGNQARLPVILRKDNLQDGRVIKKKKNSILDLLNTKPNEGENSFIFRYRLSSQLLMSTRGAFVEKIRSRGGQVIALHLLPPQHTSPIPHPKTFVSGYEVQMNNGFKQILKPEDVLWIRKPHPLDPYLSLTPMESAGIAIEIENLAKVYNRNFLLNDGRPGGLLVMRGEIDDDDKDELRSRFRGNLNKTGSVTVISSDEGVDFVDTSSSPRDAAYIQMRQITKEEILASFGVPESVIGNASGRTFSNAGEEIKVFWNETMMPHLTLLARALDDLDPEYYVDFETSNVPYLILAKQERERFLLDEYNSGLISANEYREGTGKKVVESELADSLLSNPNLTPIANTEKPFEPQSQQPVDMMGAPGAPGMPGAPGVPGMPGMPGMPGEMAPGTEGGAPALPAPIGAPTAPAEMTGYSEPPPPLGAEPAAPAPMAEPDPLAQMADVEGMVAPGISVDMLRNTQEPVPPGAASALTEEIEVKIDPTTLTEWDFKAEQSTERWTEILDRSLERLFDRQQRVVAEKAAGVKTRKALAKGTLDVGSIFDQDVWSKQLTEDIRPVLNAIVIEGALSTADNPDAPNERPTGAEYEAYLQAQMDRVQKVNDTTKEEIAAAILLASSLGSEEERVSMLKTALAAIFANLLGKRQRVIAEHEAQTAFNAGIYFGAKGNDAARKTWLTRRDTRVREEHMTLQGKTIPFGEKFLLAGAELRFPGDPLGPAHLTINCRCRLRFQ